MNHSILRAFSRNALPNAALLIMLAAVACVDAPTSAPTAAPAASDPLAQTFDALAVASGANGDLARKEGFEVAALAVRSGVSPAHIDIQVGSTEPEGMDAIVSTVDWATSIAAALRPPSRRSLVAWRRNGNGVLRVVSVLTPIDSAIVLNPLSLGAALNTAAVYAAASAQYQDVSPQTSGSLDAKASWFATSGWVKIRQQESKGACSSGSSNSPLGGFTCEKVRYGVAFNVSTKLMVGLPLSSVSDSTMAVRTTREQTVDGQHIVFACSSPKSDRGCK